MSRYHLHFVSALFVAMVLGAGSTGHESGTAQHTILPPDHLQWVAGPESLPPGVQMAVLAGDPKAKGPFVIRFKTSGDYKIPPHTHPADENVTVISGQFFMGMGDTFDPAKATELSPGGYSLMPVGVQHFAFTRGATIVQVHGIDPWGINYINPADDPRNQKGR